MDTRRLILFCIFSFSLVMLWEAWQKQQAALHAPPVATKPGQPGTSPVPSVPGSSVPSAPATPGATGASAVPSAPGVPVAAASSGAPVAGEPSAVVKTDLMTAEISAQGGDLRYVGLTQHKDSQDKDKDFVLLGSHNYYAQSGLVLPGDLPLLTHNDKFTIVPGAYELKPGQNELKVRLEAATGAVKVAKIYTFHRGSYAIDVDYEIVNGGSTPLAPSVYLQLLRDNKSPAGETRFMQTFTGAAFYTADKHFQKQDFSDIAKGKSVPVDPADNGWVAIVQHYFTTAWLPQGNAKRLFYTRKLSEELFAAGVILPVGTIAPGATGTFAAKLYAGPEEIDSMAKLAPGLERVKDYGWLTIIAEPMYNLLKFLHSYLHNWGLAIIALTVIIKLIFFPLSAASYKSMARMKKVTPKMTAIREKYANDRMKMNQAMMDLYKTEKINPLGGCLPIVIQIPVFISLYWALLATVEMRHAPFYGWITDLSAQDPYYILPLIMAVSMFLQTKMNPAPPDPVQAKMMTIMPIVFSIFFFFFPAGLVLYWVVNNILSITQQYWISRVLDDDKKAERQKNAANDASAKNKK